MAASNVTLCGICDSQHVSNIANYWCPECDEGLCSTCKNYHSVSKASRQHGIISMDDYKKLPAEICKIEQKCKEHDRKFQMFCPRHDQLCCLICISENHKECSGMYPIDEAIKSSKTSTLFDSLEKSLKDIKENIERIVKDREANLFEIKQQHLKSMNNIKDTRHKINSRLDELEKHMIDNLNLTETQLKLKIETFLNELFERKNVIEILKTNLISVKQHGSDLQTFIGSKMLEKDVTKELSYVRNISADEGLIQLGLQCKIDDKITDIISKGFTFGTVTVVSRQSSIVIGLEQEKQAQIFTTVPTCSRSIGGITASPSGNYMVPSGTSSTTITGSSVFPDGRMIFSDRFNNQRLVIVHNDGSLDCAISLSPLKPFDVTCIDDKTVAVTTSTDNRIVIIDTKTKEVKKTIITGDSQGITYRHGHIIYDEAGKGIVAIQMSNYKVTRIVKDDTNKNVFSYITTSGENIYYTGCGSTVKCYSVKGEKRWEYKDETILSCPTGIAVDQHGIVYVISNRDKCVVLISADGKNGKTFLTANDQIKESYGIYFHTNKLHVVSYFGNLFKFGIA